MELKKEDKTVVNVYRSSYWNTPFLILAMFFYTIGGTLGDGVMVLPVELARSGFWSYFVISFVPFCVETLTIILFLHFLQKVRNYLTCELQSEDGNTPYPRDQTNDSNERKSIEEIEITDNENQPFQPSDLPSSSYDETELNDRIPLIPDEYEERNEDELEEGGETNVFYDEDTDSLSQPFIHRNENVEAAVDLNTLDSSKLVTTTFLNKGLDIHTIARCYFNRVFCIFVDFVVILNLFPAVYSIGVTQTMMTLFTNDNNKVMDLTEVISPILTLLFFVVVYFVGKIADGVIAGLSLFKSLMLSLVICLGLTTFKSFHSDTNFSYFSSPYFANTFAISGSVLLIPHIFSKLRPTKCNIILFFFAVFSGILFSQIMGILWIIVVWGVVPQGSAGSDGTNEITLRNSLRNGELSNVPFSVIIREEFPHLGWLANVVEVFTFTSLSVVALLVTAILKSVVDGFVKETADFLAARRYDNDNAINTPLEARKIKRRIFCGQIMGWIFLALICTFCTWLFSRQVLVLSEIMGMGRVLVCVIFVVVLAFVDICRNPFRRVRIWLSLPRCVVLTLSFVLAAFYLFHSLYFVLYSVIKDVYVFKGEEIPF